MQMPQMIHLSVIALLVVATSGSSPALRKTPFHSQKLSSWGEARAGEAEAARAQLCTQHGFKAAERTGCVAFMRQACHVGTVALNGRVACAQFFQEEQPASEHPHDVQKGPNYESKQASQADKPDLKEDEEDGREGLAEKLTPEYTDKQVQKDWQRGPKYKSKDAQKAAQVAAKQNQAQDQDREGLADKANKQADGLEGSIKVEYSDKQAQKDFQRGPQYKSKRAQKAAGKHEEPEDEEEEEEDSQPAHYLGPIADYIDNALGNAGERKPKASKSGENPLDDAQKKQQRGPKYKSKRAQKADQPDLKEESDEVAPGDRKLTAGLPTYSEKQAQKDWQRGPNYKSKQAKKAHKKKAVEYSVPEDKEVASVPGCRNFPKGWADAKDNDCEDYAEGEWCTRHGGYGDAWLDEWGTFEDVANQGKTAKQVCCVCGGGFRKDEEDSGYDREEPKHIMTAKERQTALANGALQSQGYSGELVGPHTDQETMTSDWGREFGPGAGHRDIKTICAQNPGNEWCELHGYYDKERPKSSSSPMRMMAVFAALLFACLH